MIGYNNNKMIKYVIANCSFVAAPATENSSEKYYISYYNKSG